MRLALKLGRTLRELLASIDSAELTYWQAFDLDEPIGGDAEDYRAGLPAAVAFNLNRRQGSQAMHPLDFIPWSARSRTQVIVLEDDDEAIAAFDRTVGLH
jgi:hypothetical protein